MYFAKSSVVVGVLSFASAVQCHFQLAGADAEGVEHKFTAYSSKSSRNIVGWYSTDREEANLWVDQGFYGTEGMVCGRSYRPGTDRVRVAAGGRVRIRWVNHAPNHRGPMINYMAPCNGNCTDVDAGQLRFTKLDEMGLLEPLKTPTKLAVGVGIWASDLLFRTAERVRPSKVSPPDRIDGYGVHWDFFVPGYVAPGNYVLRQELVAIFNSKDNTQHYPRCVNLEVTGSGTDKLDGPQGMRAADLYDPSEPGITARVSGKLKNYTIPGPDVYKPANATVGLPTNTTVPSNVTSFILPTAPAPK